MSALTDYTEEGLALAVALANVGSRNRQGNSASPTQALAHVPVRIGDPDGLQRAAHQLRLILAAEAPVQAAPLINRLLRHQQARPELAPDPAGHWRLHLHPRGASAEALDLVKAASGLAVLIDEGRWAIIRQCNADRCDDFFLDQSRNTTRRYCSRTCANRVNAHLHRQRQASEQQSATTLQHGPGPKKWRRETTDYRHTLCHTGKGSAGR